LILVYTYNIIYICTKLNITMVGTKGKSGGKRDGAGRPLGVNQKAVLVKFDIDLLDYLNSKDNRNRFINDCIREKKEREE
jgi:hypothetical protein